MPLTAYLSSQKIAAPKLNDNVWSHIKLSLKQNSNYLHFKCCNSPVYARVSKKGLKHFVHKNTDHCNYIYESEDHLSLKLEVYEACKKMDWDAELEADGDNFRADVLASKNTHKAAFEIQLTRQDLQTTIDRQKIFNKSGIRCAWIFKRIPKGYRPNKFLPAFELVTENRKLITPYQCNISSRKMSIEKFIEILLNGKIRYREKFVIKRKQEAELYLFENDCFKCGYTYMAIGPWSLIKSRCGIGIENVDFSEESLALEAKKIMDELGKSNPDIAIFKKSYSKTVNEYYWANSCPKCRVIFGRHYLFDSMLTIEYEEIAPYRNVAYNIDNTDRFEQVYAPHWCIKGGEGFCDS